MKSLVTGGLGFVGSNLVDMLIEHGDEVVIIDNLSSESSTIENRNNLAKYIFEDVCLINDIEDLKSEKFDRVFHLAAEARIQPSFERPLDYFRSNTQGTAAVCEFVRQRGIKSLVYASTSSKNHGTPHLTPYTYSKVAGEGIVKTYAECFNLNCGIATFYNVYGQREPMSGEWATVVAKFERQWRSGETLTVVGDGSQTRDFTFIGDICAGLIKISEGSWMGDNFDLGRGEPISILDMAKCWSDEIEFVPLRRNEGHKTSCDWKTTQERLGWRATRSLRDYIINKKTQI